MRTLYQGTVIALVLLVTGCGQVERTPFPVVAEQVIEQEVSEVQPLEVTEAGLKMFFTEYFSLPEEEVLLLNQNPPLIDSAYWDTYKAYKEKLSNRIGHYLSPEAKEKIEEQYRTYDFHLPKKLQLNEYVTFGPAAVEWVHIVDARPSGENTIYQVAVSTRNQVETVTEANKKYQWQEDKHYYVQAELSENSRYTFSVTDKETEEKMNQSYVYAQEASLSSPDEIKLIQHYWVEVRPENRLLIESVKEASPIQVNENTRQLANNTKHIRRVAYWPEPSMREQSLIKTVMSQLMQQPENFYTYYEKAFHTSYDVFKLVWEKDLELEKQVTISESSYKEAFNTLINPYKHTVKKIAFESAKMKIFPSVYATKKQPRFIVYVPVKAELSDNQTAYYTYKYYVGIDQSKVETIRFMNREELTEEAYLNEASEANKGENEVKETDETEEIDEAKETKEDTPVDSEEQQEV
jgi:hypothetical protein